MLTDDLDREYNVTNVNSSINNIQRSDVPITSKINSCSVVYDKDSDFGDIIAVELPVEGIG